MSPKDDQHDAFYKHLYLKLTKQYLQIVNPPTPYILCLIMRRSSGLQALECHVFIFDDIKEATVLTNRIKEVCFMNESLNVYRKRPSDGKSNVFGIYENQKINRSNSVRVTQDLDNHDRSRQITCREKEIETAHAVHKRSKSVVSNKQSFFEKLKTNLKYKSRENLAKLSEKNSRTSAYPSSPDSARKKITNPDVVSLKSEKKYFSKNSTSRAKSPTPSQYSKADTCRNDCSVADVDFQKNKRLLDEGLLIDNSKPMMQLCRPVTPNPKPNKYVKQQRSRSVLGSPSGYFSDSKGKF
jgi:hypothetical protein